MSEFTQQIVFEYSGDTYVEGGLQIKIVKAGNYFYCVYEVNTSLDDPYEIRVSKSLDGVTWVDAEFPQTLQGGNSNMWASMAVDSNNKIHLCFNVDGYDISSEGTAKIAYTTYTEGIGWSVIEELTTFGYYYGFPVMALDTNNKPHIVYGNHSGEIGGEQDIFYTNRVSGSWIAWQSVIDSNILDMGWHTNILIKSDGEVNIFYSGSTNEYSNYCVYRTYGSASNWTTELIIEDMLYFNVVMDSEEEFHVVGGGG